MASTKSEQKPHVKTRPAEIVSTDEAVNLHRGEWILMRVTSFDERHEPLAGVVVAHSSSYSRVCSKLSKEIRAPLEPGAHYYIFLGEPRGRTGEDLRRQLEELAAQEDQRHARRQ